MAKDIDVIIVGAGHNGLTAAAYLGMAGRKVTVLEAAEEAGGASTSVRAFPSYDARLSRYSYLVSLLPDKIVHDLGLDFTCLSRRVSSYTPYRKNGKSDGLLVNRQWDETTAESFRRLTGDDREAEAWGRFYTEVESFAQRLAPTLLEPLRTRSEMKGRIGQDDAWRMLMETPIGETVTQRFHNDLVRGVVLTDALIGTHTSVYDLQANRCFLYHLIGNGTGEWKVPRGGMGGLVSELKRVCLQNGVEILTGARVTSIHAGTGSVEACLADGRSFKAPHLLCNAAPQTLARLMGRPELPSLEGAQLKVNMLLTRLPRLASGADPREAFAGTLHIREELTDLEKAYEESRQGLLPTRLPAEMYCHTLTDPSILSPELQAKGYHTLTLFGLHTPASLFENDSEGSAEIALARALEGLNECLDEPVEDCIARNPDGSLCIEVKTPLDLEASIGLPRGNIFHRDLSFPFREDDAKPGWGVETDHPRVLLCGAGAVRGGGVSGIPGHNAAMALLKGL